MSAIKFEPLYFGDKIHLINPHGDIGIITLWSPVNQVLDKLRDIDSTLIHPDQSRIAVVANLYGDGMFPMFCNLLHNPQINHLIAMGQDLGLPVCEEIDVFLKHGLEDCTVFGKPMMRIIGTKRYFPSASTFNAASLRERLSFRNFGKLSGTEFKPSLQTYLQNLPVIETSGLPRVSVDIPQFESSDFAYLPSDPIGHQVIRPTPIQCWEELVVRAMRFGRPVDLQKGLRLELQNVKVVISQPAEEPEETLEKFGFQLSRFRSYQKGILDAHLPENIAYTYGNRLRGYYTGNGKAKETPETVRIRLKSRLWRLFKRALLTAPEERECSQDTLATVIELFNRNPETRHAYVSLWDTPCDLKGPDAGDGVSVPCLTTLFFRRSQGTLHVTATYRSHNLLTAWLENVYGLMAIQRHVADATSIPCGPITVISHSLGINPESTRFAYGEAVRDSWKSDDDFREGKYVLREDPTGYFVVSFDVQSGCIIAEHRHEGVLLKRYEGRRAEDVEKEVAKDMAISLVSHAMWFGRELARKEQDLKNAMKSADSGSAERKRGGL